MKLASFNTDNDGDLVGLEVSDGIFVSVTDALSILDDQGQMPAPADMIELIKAGESILGKLREARSIILSSPNRVKTCSADEINWHPPVRFPSKVVCIALNNRALDKVKIRAPTDHPAFFLKPNTALTGHMQSINLRESYGLTHPEPEIAVVISRVLKDETPESAMNGVFGYTIMNDITSVGMREEDSFSVRYYKPGERPGEVSLGEAHTTYPGRYKASDTFAPLGPCITTRDEIPDPSDLRISCTLGDRLVASDHSKNYVWSVADALSHISRTMTLLPGDVVSMGTAVGGDEDDEKTPEVPGVTKANLAHFDGLVTVSISKLGSLSNTVKML